MTRAARCTLWPLWLMLFAAPVTAEQTELLLGVHPYRSAHKVYRAFDPLRRYLATQLGRPVRLQVAADYAGHLHAIGTNKVDIAYVGPVPYLSLAKEFPPAKRIVARQLLNGKPYYHGHLFVARDSALQRIEDLKGKQVSLVDPLSTMGFYLPVYMIAEAGLLWQDLGGYRLLGSHDNVALSVLSGDADAGAMRELDYAAYAQRGLRLLARSPPVDNHVFVVGDRVSEPDLTQLRKLFLAMADHEQGRAALSAIAPAIDGMVAVSGEPFAGLKDIVEKVNRDCPLP